MNTEEILIIIVCSFVGCMLCCSCYQYSLTSENEYSHHKKRRAMKLPRKRVSPTSTFIEIDYDIMETRDVESNHHS